MWVFSGVNGLILLPQNSLLNLMFKDAPTNLAVSLECVDLPQGPLSLACTDRYVYFPLDALVTLTQINPANDAVDVAVVGCHACIGPSELWGTPMQAMVMVPGHAYRLDWTKVKQDPDLYSAWLWHITMVIHGLIEQMAQTAFCARHHNTAQRLASWFLICLAQHDAAFMWLPLAVLPASLRQQERALHAALHALENLRAVELSDARVHVLGAERLARVACRCHNMVKPSVAASQPRPL